MTGDSSRRVWLQQARSYLRDADPVLARLIDDRPEFDPRAWMAELPPMDLYGALLFPGHRPAAVGPGDPPHPGPASLRSAQRSEHNILIINKAVTPGRVTAIIVSERLGF